MEDERQEKIGGRCTYIMGGYLGGIIGSNDWHLIHHVLAYWRISREFPECKLKYELLNSLNDFYKRRSSNTFI